MTEAYKVLLGLVIAVQILILAVVGIVLNNFTHEKDSELKSLVEKRQELYVQEKKLEALTAMLNSTIEQETGAKATPTVQKNSSKPPVSVAIDIPPPITPVIPPPRVTRAS